MNKDITINQALDTFLTRYTFSQIKENSDLTALYNKLTAYKHMLGGKQMISPDGELITLFNKYIYKEEL